MAAAVADKYGRRKAPMRAQAEKEGKLNKAIPEPVDDLRMWLGVEIDDEGTLTATRTPRHVTKAKKAAAAMAKKKVQQFCLEIPVDVELTFKVKVEGVANEQEALEEAEQAAREYAVHADAVDLGTIRFDAEFTKELMKIHGIVSLQHKQ
jgi:hypothetical protein